MRRLCLVVAICAMASFIVVATTGCHSQAGQTETAGAPATTTEGIKPMGASAAAQANPLDNKSQADQAATIDRVKAKRGKAAGTAP